MEQRLRLFWERVQQDIELTEKDIPNIHNEATQLQQMGYSYSQLEQELQRPIQRNQYPPRVHYIPIMEKTWEQAKEEEERVVVVLARRRKNFILALLYLFVVQVAVVIISHSKSVFV